MAKASGNTRTVRPTSETRTQNYQVYKNEIAMSDVDASQSYFSMKSGGYVIVMKQGDNRKDDNRKRSDEEMEAARAMANDGLIVVMTPEGGVQFKSGKTKQGNATYADGLVMGYSYEQSTKNPSQLDTESLKKSIDGALKHACDKNAQIPLIYDRYGRFHRQDIENGLAHFEEKRNYKFKSILVVDKNGNLYEHQHNK